VRKIPPLEPSRRREAYIDLGIYERDGKKCVPDPRYVCEEAGADADYQRNLERFSGAADPCKPRNTASEPGVKIVKGTGKDIE
jgi:hypothetical protein